jgi:ABC-type oligopeptide transport system substrate-binding subunit
MQSNSYPAAWSERWFQELGVRTHITYDPPILRMQRLKAGDYDVLYGALIATVPDAGDLLSPFLTSAEDNNMKWADKDVIRLLNEANTKTGKERLAVLEQAERAVMAAVPTVPMMFERRQSMLAAEVRGWYEDPLARQSPKRLWLDPAQSAGTASKPGI